MATSSSFSDVAKFSSEIPQKLVQLMTIVTNLLHKAFHHIFNSMTTVANSVAILLCYLYLKNFRSHSMILVDGYVAIFQIFAEYIGAIVCVCYGLLEMDLHYMVLGLVGIALGLCLKALVLYRQKLVPNEDECASFIVNTVSAVYLISIFLSCSAFHDIASKVGALRCATRILTFVVPLVALSDAFRAGGSFSFSLCADALALSALWWHCAHLSLKYFLIVPSVIGIIFTFIRYVLDAIQEAASREVVTDLYK